MGNSAAILFKLARNAKKLGLTVNSESQSAVVINNGSNDLTISYVDASFSPSVVGGVDSSVSPFLGIGVGNPGKIQIKCEAGTTMATFMDTAVPAQVLAMCASLANNILLVGAGNQALAEIRGHSDIIGLGQ
jgi:uncharacterized protein (DUF1786 family)